MKREEFYKSVKSRIFVVSNCNVCPHFEMAKVRHLTIPFCTLHRNIIDICHFKGEYDIPTWCSLELEQPKIEEI